MAEFSKEGKEQSNFIQGQEVQEGEETKVCQREKRQEEQEGQEKKTRRQKTTPQTLTIQRYLGTLVQFDQFGLKFCLIWYGPRLRDVTTAPL